VKEARGLFCLLTDKIDAEVLDAAPHLQGVFFRNNSLSVNQYSTALIYHSGT
jgi:hypothetical protein